MDTAGDVRYPIGEFRRVASSMAGIRAAHIATLRALPERLKLAAEGLDDRQLDTPYRDGGWSLRQVVHHLADSHTNAYIRFKLALTEDHPTINAYDEKAWANLPDSLWLPIQTSLDMVTAVHARWVALLDALGEEDFHKGYNHPQDGFINLAQALAIYDWHSRHHTAHITRLRTQNGW